MAEKLPRGWNLRKGGKDAPSTDELRKRGAKGGSVTGRKTGFSDKSKHREILAKATDARKRKAQEDSEEVERQPKEV